MLPARAGARPRTEARMRIYEGSPRQDWEEVLRAIGSFADRERLKELLFLELEDGFVLQGLTVPESGAWSESSGLLTKRTYELLDEQVAQLMEESLAQRGTAADPHPHVEIANYYEQSMRVLGSWIDAQKARDIFFFEQDGSYVLRLLLATPTATGHQLAEFTKDEMLAMIDAAPQQRERAPEAGAQA
jgi:hypothetical protein